MEKTYRIGFMGAPGSGKTTMASKLSEKLEIPFLASRSMTQPILDRDGFSYNSGVYVESFLAKPDREFELVRARVDTENELKSFVTDRTILENFTYALLEIEQYSYEDMNELQKICQNHAKKYTDLYYCIRSDNIKENGIRTTNKWFQMKIDHIIRGLVKDWDIKVIETDGDIDKIVKHIKSR